MPLRMFACVLSSRLFNLVLLLTHDAYAYAGGQDGPDDSADDCSVLGPRLDFFEHLRRASLLLGFVLYEHDNTNGSTRVD